jgi:hypothetical protein
MTSEQIEQFRTSPLLVHVVIFAGVAGDAAARMGFSGFWTTLGVVLGCFFALQVVLRAWSRAKELLNGAPEEDTASPRSDSLGS